MEERGERDEPSGEMDKTGLRAAEVSQQNKDHRIADRKHKSKERERNGPCEERQTD